MIFFIFLRLFLNFFFSKKLFLFFFSVFVLFFFCFVIFPLSKIVPFFLFSFKNKINMLGLLTLVKVNSGSTRDAFKGRGHKGTTLADTTLVVDLPGSPVVVAIASSQWDVSRRAEEGLVEETQTCHEQATKAAFAVDPAHSPLGMSDHHTLPGRRASGQRARRLRRTGWR